ncbi:MAG TPA: hypothetical protein H9903_16195 [Candidatus Aquabacterium excrementipullorum]|nr:hypothetical protein [Candidatus Aquabacterium excrementipullorum]
MSPLHYLTFDLSDDTDGVGTIEAMASTAPAQADAVDAEIRQVLDWAWRQFPHSHGRLDEGHDWDHDLQTAQEQAGDRAWRTVTLTISASPAFMEAFTARFSAALE